jgi:hypothetical protein
MGTGTNAARAAGAGLHADVIDNFKDQFLVALLKRLGPNVSIPIAEIDATGDSIVKMHVDQGKQTFEFTVEKKQ